MPAPWTAGCGSCPRYLPGGLSPYVAGQSGYKRLRAALPLIKHLIRTMATHADLWAKPV